MNQQDIIREWFFRLPNGYANPPYSKKEMGVLHEVLTENGLNGSIFVKEVDQLDQAFHDAKPIEDEEAVNIREALIKISMASSMKEYFRLLIINYFLIVPYFEMRHE